MHDTYFRAAIPEPYTILGVRLLPLSLGRYQLLKRFDCGFVADGELAATWNDLLVGILICSMPVKEFLVFLESKERPRQLKLWEDRIRREMEADPHFSYLSKIGLFRCYIERHSQIPKHWDESDSPVGSCAHWSQTIEIGLRCELGYSEEEINERPLSKALYDYFKHAENQGLIRLMADDEEQHGLDNARLLKEALGKGGLCPASN